MSASGPKPPPPGGRHRYWVELNGETVGADLETLLEWCREEKVTPDTSIFDQQENRWIRAKKLRALRPALPSTPNLALPLGILGLIAAVAGVGVLVWSAPDPPVQQEVRLSADEQAFIERCGKMPPFDPHAKAHVPVLHYTMQVIDDPFSVEFRKCTEPTKVPDACWMVTCEFGGTNALGAWRRGYWRYHIEKGQVVRHEVLGDD